MLNQSSAILAGVVASVVITPMMIAAWKKIDPPEISESFELDSDTRSIGKSIDREAAIAAVFFALSSAYFLGWNTELSGISTAIFFSGVIAVPYLWTVIRCVVAEPERTRRYLLYYQSEHGVGVRLARTVGLGCTYILAISLALHVFWVR